MVNSSRWIAGAALLGSVVAQQGLAQSPASKPGRTIEKSRFLPLGYEAEVRFHLAELTDIGFIDELRKSSLWMFVPKALNPMQFRVQDIEWITILPAVGDKEESFTVIEGRPELVHLPPLGSDLPSAQIIGWKSTEHHEFRGRHVLLETPRWQGSDPFAGHSLWVSPEPGVVVYGPRVTVEAALSGRAKRGLPSMQVLEMRGHRALMSAVVPVTAEDIEQLSDVLETKAWISKSNPLEYAAARFTEAAEDQFVIDAVLRFRKAGAAPAALGKALRAGHAVLLKKPQMRMLRSALDGLTVEVSGLDVVLTCELGDADQVSALLTNAAVVQLGMLLQALPGEFVLAGNEVIEIDEETGEVEEVGEREPEEELEAPKAPPTPQSKPAGGQE